MLSCSIQHPSPKIGTLALPCVHSYVRIDRPIMYITLLFLVTFYGNQDYKPAKSNTPTIGKFSTIKLIITMLIPCLRQQILPRKLKKCCLKFLLWIFKYMRKLHQLDSEVMKVKTLYTGTRTRCVLSLTDAAYSYT